MSDAAPSNLIHLIRLLDGNLSAGEEDSARSRLADNAELADRYRYLTQIVRRPMTADALMGHVDEVDPSEIAEFLEQRMTASEQAAFEQRCWSSDSLLREVVSNCRAKTETAASSRDVPPAGHVPTVVAAVLAHAGSAAEPLESAADTQGPTSPDPSGISSELPQIEISGSPSQVRRSPRQNSSLMLVAAGLVLAMLVFGLPFVWKSNSDRHAQQDDTDRIISPEQNDSFPPIVRDDPKSKPNPPPDDPEPLQKSDPTPIVRDDPKSKPDPRPDAPEPPQKPDSLPIVNNDPKGNAPTIPQPRPFVPPVRTLVEWSEIRGIAGARNTDTNEWSGILARNVTGLWKSSTSTQLLTLADSSVSGQAVNGARLIADANSLMTISAVWKSDSRKSEAEGELIPVCEMQAGRAAFDGLMEGQRVIAQVNGQSYDVVASSDDTTIAFETETAGIVLAAYRGKVTVDGKTLSRRQWARISRADGLAAFRPSQVKNWPRTKAVTSTLPVTLCTTFNQSASLIREAAARRQVQNPGTAYVATQITLQCSTSDGRPIPPQMARQIANSRNETQRQTMVTWLVARSRQGGTDTSLQDICQAAQVDQTTTREMTGWFNAAARSRPPTSQQLRELFQTLDGNAPIFTRQCAKYFLQQITGDPMNDYDPAATVRQRKAAKNRIVSVARQIQQGN